MERYELNEKGLVVSETLQNGDKIEISFKIWDGSKAGKTNRWYVKRAGEQIGWIAEDLSKAEGKTSTNTHYLNLMIKAMQNK